MEDQKKTKKQWIRKDQIKGAFQQKSFSLGSYSTFASAAVIAIAIVVVLIVQQLPANLIQIDCTSNQLYSLSDQTKQMVSGITDKDITIYFIAQTGNEDGGIKNLLNKYQSLNDKIKVEQKDPVVYPNFVKQYTQEQVYDNSLIVECGSKSRYIPYTDIYVTNYDYTNYSSTTEFDGENSITSAIDYVTNDNMPKIYVLSGHGEQELDSSMQSAIEKENYAIEELTLITGESVPEDAGCLLINAPSSDISQTEKDSILNYLKAGGHMLLFTQYSDTDLPNLAAVMEYYGVKANHRLVFDGDANHSLRGYNHYLLPNLQSHEITTPIQEGGYYVLAPMAEGIEVSSSRDTVTVTELLKTSSSGYAKENGYAAQTVEKEAGDSEGAFTVGVAISETLSQDTDGEDQNQDTDTQDTSTEEQEENENQTKIVWYTTPYIMNSQINQMVSGANTDLVMNSIGWMCERTQNISIRAKSLNTESLTVSTSASSLWSAIFIGVIPLALFGAGIYIWIRRRRR